jgi:hypothetical protein
MNSQCILRTTLVAATLGVLLFATVNRLREHAGRDEEAAKLFRDGESVRSLDQTTGPAGGASHRPVFRRGRPALEALAAQARSVHAAWQAATIEERYAVVDQFIGGLDAAALQRLLMHHEELVPGSMQRDVVRAGLVRLAELNAPLAATLAGRIIEEASLREELRAHVARRWADVDPLAAAQWVAEWPHGTYFDASTWEHTVHWLSGRLMAEHPDAAGDLLGALPAGPAKRELLAQLMRQWRESDFDAALAWARELSDSADRQHALLQLGHRWAVADPAAAVAFAETLPAKQDPLLAAFASQWVQRDAAAAAEWAAALPAGVRREKVIGSMAAAWSAQDPRSAVEFVLQLGAGPEQSAAAISVVSAWAAVEPAAMAQWVEQFPPGRDRAYAIENVLLQWTQSDPAAAVVWLERWPAGPDRDAAVNAGAAGLLETHPHLAAHWAESIDDEAMRWHQMQRAARRWLETDPGAARMWIARTDLSAALKQDLLSGE